MANTTTALDIACSLLVRAKRRNAKAARRESPLYIYTCMLSMIPGFGMIVPAHINNAFGFMAQRVQFYTPTHTARR